MPDKLCRMTDARLEGDVPGVNASGEDRRLRVVGLPDGDSGRPCELDVDTVRLCEETGARGGEGGPDDLEGE